MRPNLFLCPPSAETMTGLEIPATPLSDLCWARSHSLMRSWRVHRGLSPLPIAAGSLLLTLAASAMTACLTAPGLMRLGMVEAVFRLLAWD